MTTVEIRSNKDLVNYLDELESTTNTFFDSGERSVKGLSTALVTFHVDLEFNERMCKRIANSFKYFRGVLDGNGVTLTVAPIKSTSLFSSVYYSIIKNLKIHNSYGSRGFLLADDATHTVFQNIEVTGVIAVEESGGGLLKTGHYVTFENCSVDIQTVASKADTTLEQVSATPIHFGGYIGVDLGDSKFKDCLVSGKMVSEVAVAGFCATSKGSTFNNCSAVSLHVGAKREAALFVARSTKDVTLVDCKIYDCTIKASIYVGFITGRAKEHLYIDNLEVVNSFISPNSAASFIGGITGTAEKLTLVNSNMSGGISANFILAGVCPDVEHAEVINNTFDLTIAASGYLPMMTHAYKLVRTEFLTSSGKDTIFIEENNKININVVELGNEGFVNPFEESIL